MHKRLIRQLGGIDVFCIAAGAIGRFSSWFSLGLKNAFSLVGIGVFATLINPNITDWQLGYGNRSNTCFYFYC